MTAGILEIVTRTFRGIVHTYNDSRPHSSLDYLTPNKAHN
ncbi:integrase core domain-containing protein [Elizabethkingia ursingii]